MKVITEAVLRDELRAEKPETYTIPEGKILSPAAREYLQQYRIKVIECGRASVHSERSARPGSRPPEQSVPPAAMPTAAPQHVAEPQQPKYQDYDSGGYYYEKPEHMTQLFDNMLVPKNHKRIYFRGKLDSLQALFVLNQATLLELGEPRQLLDDLGDILGGLREMMRCDVLNETFRKEVLIGLTHQELREHSHNPQKYYQVKQMVLPDYTMGKTYALLNQLRTAVRETEVAAVGAFSDGRKYERRDIIQELNRMSSAIHIIMCRYLAGMYKKQEAGWKN